MIAYALGARLNRTLAEIWALPEEEFFGWVAYFELTSPK
jgi:hypothetical protein